LTPGVLEVPDVPPERVTEASEVRRQRVSLSGFHAGGLRAVEAGKVPSVIFSVFHLAIPNIVAWVLGTVMIEPRARNGRVADEAFRRRAV